MESVKTSAMHDEATVAAREEIIETTDGLRLFVRSWTPHTPRAAVVLCHGFNSHSGYYVWTGEQLAAHGFAVYALDLRGRGHSDGERFYVQSIAEWVENVHAVVQLTASRHSGLAIFLLGHSAGGVVSCLYALEHQRELAGLICESFAFELPAPDFALAALKGLAHLAPHAHVLRLRNADFSRDPKVVAAMDADPLIAHETQPTQSVAELARADDRLRRDFARLTLPLLIIHGTADRAAKASGSQTFHDAAGSPDKTLKLYEGFYHDPLNDLGKEEVLGDIVAWIESRVPSV